MKILNKKEGLAIIKKLHFKICSEHKEGNEHIYYDGGENGYLVYNKFLEDFIFYESKLNFNQVLLAINNSEEPEINFSDFQEKIPTRLENLSNLLKIEISLNDSLSNLKKIDSKILETQKQLKEFSASFMDFFSYYYIILKNELNFPNFKIQESDGLVEFYIFSSNENDKREIFRSFYKLIIDDDNTSNLYQCADNIINPLILKTGSIKDSPLKENE